MRFLKRNRRTVYLCTEYQDGDIRKFKAPVELKLNYQYTNSESDLIALGDEFPMYIRIKMEPKYAVMFKAKDRVYINLKPAEPFDELCRDANYEVDSDPLISLNTIEVTLKRLSGK